MKGRLSDLPWATSLSTVEEMLSYCLRKGKEKTKQRKHVFTESLLLRIPTRLWIKTRVCTRTPKYGLQAPSHQLLPLGLWLPLLGGDGAQASLPVAHTPPPLPTAAGSPPPPPSLPSGLSKSALPQRQLSWPDHPPETLHSLTPALLSSWFLLLLSSFSSFFLLRAHNFLFTKMGLAYSRRSINVL